MKIALAALMALALAGALAFASAAHAQLPPIIVGGGTDSPPPGDGTTSETLTDPGPALLSGSGGSSTGYFLSPYLLMARLHSWFAPVTLQTPTSGMLSARSVRFASAGRPNARVSRVTW